MFKYTKASINILLDDIKKYAKIFKWISFGFTLAFTTYQIIIGFIHQNGLVFINIIMALLIISSTLVDVVLAKYDLKIAKKISARVFKWVKISIKAFSLGVTIYDIYKTPAGQTTGISIILAVLMILLWIASFIAEIAVEIISDRAEELLVAWKADVDDIKRPLTAVSDTFKKMTGKYKAPEIDEKKEKTLTKLKERIKSDKITDEDEEEDEN